MNCTCGCQLRLPFELPHIPTVFIVEPDAATRDAMARLVAEAGWHPALSATAEEFLARPRVIGAGCMLVEQHLPGMDGLALQEFVADRKETPVIFMSDRTDIQATVKAMKGGAFEFLSKPVRDQTLLDSIGLAIEHSFAALCDLVRIQEFQQRYQELSRRERDVMRLVVAGRLNKQVGAELGISEITVKAHRGSVMRKMVARSLADLVGMGAVLGVRADSRHAVSDLERFFGPANARAMAPVHRADDRSYLS